MSDSTSTLPIAAIVLAAGASKRLGRPKQLLRLDGEALVRRAARFALEAGCSPVIVVLGYEAELIGAELVGLPVGVAGNQRWEQGMGTSLACGIARLEQEASALVMVCDQIGLDTMALTRLLDLHRSSGAPLTASRYAGRVGVPAVFAKQYFPELACLTGDHGARDLIQRHRDHTAIFEFPAGVDDVDEPSDWECIGRPK